MILVFILGGENKEVQYEEGESLLEAAIRADINPPYSCMEGVCTACMAKVVEGQVDFPDDTILDDAEAKQGMTLTCQAMPAKGCDKLVINYDI